MKPKSNPQVLYACLIAPETPFGRSRHWLCGRIGRSSAVGFCYRSPFGHCAVRLIWGEAASPLQYLSKSAEGVEPQHSSISAMRRQRVTTLSQRASDSHER